MLYGVSDGQQHDPPQEQQHAPIVQQTTDDHIAMIPSMKPRKAITESIAVAVLSYKAI